MRIILLLSLLTWITFSCDRKDGKIELRESISSFEDSIRKLSNNLQPGERIPSVLNQELIELLVSYYHKYPDDVHAPEYLDKVHLMYSAMKNYSLSAKYADTILLKYKNYINRNFILESQASAYDIFIKPRDTAKVRYYNELLLEENKDLPKEKIEEIKFRLRNLHLSIDEIISTQITK